MSKKLSYIHNSSKYLKKRSTIALELPKSEDLLKYVRYFVETGAVYFPLLCGITLVHPKDNFNKSIGRKEAEKNLILRTVEIKTVYIDQKDISIFVKISDNQDISFKVYHDSKKVRIIKNDYY